MTVDDRVTISGLVDGGTPASPPLAPPAHQAAPRRTGSRVAPDLIGLDGLEAHACAHDADVRLSVSVWETNVGPWGRVIDQVPPPGTSVRRGGRIRVVVSGPPYVQVPDVRGMSLSTAIEKLAWLGFVPLAGAPPASRSVPAHHVIAALPAVGSLAAHGSVVVLTTAKGDGNAGHRSSGAEADLNRRG